VPHALDQLWLPRRDVEQHQRGPVWRAAIRLPRLDQLRADVQIAREHGLRGMQRRAHALRVIAYHEVSRGTLDSVLVHPREVFKAALLANAAAIVATHVHPSGGPTPSPDDVAVTRRLAAAGEILGIPLLDHIIIGDGRYYSHGERAALGALGAFGRPSQRLQGRVLRQLRSRRRAQHGSGLSRAALPWVVSAARS